MNYFAPEIVIKEKLTQAVDWWALGVLLCELLLGVNPFLGNTEEDTKENIVHGDVGVIMNWMRPRKLISKEAYDFLCKLLIKSPAQRLCGFELNHHPFLKEIDIDAIENAMLGRRDERSSNITDS